MRKITFISGNQFKVNLLTDYLGLAVDHIDLDLDEIQSFDLREIIEYKAKQAYELIKKPVLVEDNALEIKALGRLPGPFIKWFLQELGDEGICRILDGFPERGAYASVCYGYYDGDLLKKFYGGLNGSIVDRPRGKGHGWNTIFIPEGSSKTYAQMPDQWFEQYGLRAATVFPELKEFLTTLDRK
ncbi:MAG TPA: non-canonical purine NTP pyrophosphatase [Candidatus Saccharimonadales bacterium]|nr:non-canonical purine NTP pyrophosphatase [Candidatus Saccharimonadales bacterium]